MDNHEYRPVNVERRRAACAESTNLQGKSMGTVQQHKNLPPFKDIGLSKNLLDLFAPSELEGDIRTQHTS